MTDRAHDTTRVEAFSDGVFAFSATLLVVSLEVPTTFSELVGNLEQSVVKVLSCGAVLLAPRARRRIAGESVDSSRSGNEARGSSSAVPRGMTFASGC